MKPTCSSRPVGNQLQGSGAACLLVEAPVVLLRCRVLCPSRHSAGRRSVQLGKKNKNKSADVWWARPQRVSRPSNQTHVSPSGRLRAPRASDARNHNRRVNISSSFHDLPLRSYIYHCVWSVITAHNLTPEKRNNNYSPHSLTPTTCLRNNIQLNWHLSLLRVSVRYT